jgi:undecaprenyl-diphosphatase
MSNTGLFLTVLLLVCVILLIRALAFAVIRRLVNARPMGKVSPYGRTAAISAALLLRSLHPGLFAILRRRLQLGTFTGLPLTLLVLAALYIAALIAGLTHEVLEAEDTLRKHPARTAEVLRQAL